MQFIELKRQNGNKSIAIFIGDCELTTSIGTDNEDGV